MGLRWVAISLAALTLTGVAAAMPGDDCQCGDVNDDRTVNALDVQTYRAHLANPSGSPLTLDGAAKCKVAGAPASPCNVLDVSILRRSVQALQPGISPVCAKQYGTNGNVVRFATFGAHGKGNQNQVDVATAVVDRCLDRCCDFVQLLGNNIYDEGVESPTDGLWFTHFEAPYQNVDMSFWAILGDHDYGLGLAPEVAKAQHQVDYSAFYSTKFEMPAFYWHRSVEHVEFFGLDSTLTRWSQDAQQRLDVDAWLDASTATWRIAAGLHCYRSNGPHGNAGCYEGLCFPPPVLNGSAVKTFYDDILCGRVDLALCAFDHSMQWPQQTCAGTELIVAGTGSSNTDLPGSQPTHFQSLSIGFVLIEIDGNSLRADFYDTSSTLLFSRTLTKP